jgi:hypothetical protein
VSTEEHDGVGELVGQTLLFFPSHALFQEKTGRFVLHFTFC